MLKKKKTLYPSQLNQKCNTLGIYNRFKYLKAPKFPRKIPCAVGNSRHIQNLLARF